MRSTAPNTPIANTPGAKADGLHFCGLAHLQLGERELARQRLTGALALREQLGHGRFAETRGVLDRLIE
jgi:hypothetical protein